MLPQAGQQQEEEQPCHSVASRDWASCVPCQAAYAFRRGDRRGVPSDARRPAGFVSGPLLFYLKHQLMSRELLSWQPLNPEIYSSGAETGGTLTLGILSHGSHAGSMIPSQLSLNASTDNSVVAALLLRTNRCLHCRCWSAAAMRAGAAPHSCGAAADIDGRPGGARGGGVSTGGLLQPAPRQQGGEIDSAAGG